MEQPHRRAYDRGLPLRLAGSVESDRAVKYREQVSPARSKLPFFSAAAVFSFLFTFICFFPNPALPIGAHTGLQAGQVMALLSLPVVVWAWGLPRRQTLALLLLILPVLLSGFLAVLTGRALSDDIVVKSVIAVMLIFAVLVPVGAVLNKRYTTPLLSGVVWAIVLHVIVGAFQAYWFVRHVFPLSGLYQNPSFTFRGGFAATQLWALASYVDRPFGLFPEPSAMAASIGPWLVLIVGLLLYSRLRHEMTHGSRILLVLVVIVGVGLIVFSQSGYTFFLLASLLLVGLPALGNNVSRLYRPGSLLALSALVVVGVAITVLSVAYLSPRVGIQTNSSWAERLDSIVLGISYLGASPSNLFFGVGPGQSYLLLQAPGPLSLLPQTSVELSINAVASVVVTYIQEAGLLGVLALALVLLMVLRAIVRSSARLMGLGCLVAWLAGVVFTTSYLPLLPIWLFLGVLLGWDRIFEVRAAPKDLEPDVSPVRSVMKT